MGRDLSLRAGGAKKVLVVDSDDGQNRSALAAVRALAVAGFEPFVAASTRWSLAASSRFSAGVVPSLPTGDPAFATTLSGAVKSGDYLAVLPASDAALSVLGHAGHKLTDKIELIRRVERAGLASVPARTFDTWAEIMAAAGELTYPIVVKAAVKLRAGHGVAVRVDSQRALARLTPRPGPVVVQEWIDAPMSAVGGVFAGGDLLAAVHQRYLRTWPVQCGVASAAVTVAPDEALERQLARLLEGYDGIFQAQFIGRFLIDVNPRVYGSLPLAVAAGANLPAIWCNWIADGSRRHSGTLRGRPGVSYRWLEGDLKHLLWTARRRGGTAVLSALRPRRPTAHSVESLGDLRPLAVRAGYVFRHRLGSPGGAL